MKQFSLKLKAVSGNIIILVVALTLLCVFIGIYTMNIGRELVRKNLAEMSSRYANELKGDWEKSYEVCATLTSSVETLWSLGIRDRDKINSVLEASFGKNPELVGTGTAWEVGAFDGNDSDYIAGGEYGVKGQYSVWYYRADGKVLWEAWADGYEAEDYYRIPVTTKEPFITDPYWYETATGKYLLVTIAIPIIPKGEVLGIVTVDVDMTSYVEMMKRVRPYGVGDTAVFNSNGTVVSHIEPERIGRHMEETEKDVVGENIGPMVEAAENGEMFEFTIDLGFREGLVIGRLTPFTIGDYPGSFSYAAAVPLNIPLADINKLIKIIIISFIGAVILIGLFTYFFTDYLTKPVVVISEFLDKKLTEGILFEELEAKLTRKGDEIGVASRSTNKLISKLREVISGIQEAASQVVSGSSQISDSSQRISTGASEQASSIEELTSSMEELAATITQNSENADIANSKASKVTADAQRSGEAANGANDLITRIAEKISIIGEFSRNTNMLALNAAIEAARAGEEGKGFAVVAQEIRKLAVNSQAAANEIMGMAGTGVKAVENVKEIIDSIVPELQETSQLIQEITAASAEQSQGAEQMNSALQQMNTIVQDNASVSEELASMAEELNAQAEGMNTAVGFFRIDKKSARQKTETGTGYRQEPRERVSAGPQPAGPEPPDRLAGPEKRKEQLPLPPQRPAPKDSSDDDFEEF